MRIVASVFATVVILAKAANHVYGFSVMTPLLPGGWKSYSYRISEDTSQTLSLYMADANDEGEEMEGISAMQDLQISVVH